MAKLALWVAAHHSKRGGHTDTAELLRELKRNI